MPYDLSSSASSSSASSSLAGFFAAAAVALQCPICLSLYRDPVSLRCSHVFCRACVERCLAARPQCPLCNDGAAANARSIAAVPRLAHLTGLVRAAAAEAGGRPEVAREVARQVAAAEAERARRLQIRREKQQQEQQQQQQQQQQGEEGGEAAQESALEGHQQEGRTPAAEGVVRDDRVRDGNDRTTNDGAAHAGPSDLPTTMTTTTATTVSSPSNSTSAAVSAALQSTQRLDEGSNHQYPPRSGTESAASRARGSETLPSSSVASWATGHNNSNNNNNNNSNIGGVGNNNRQRTDRMATAALEEEGEAATPVRAELYRTAVPSSSVVSHEKRLRSSGTLFPPPPSSHLLSAPSFSFSFVSGDSDRCFTARTAAAAAAAAPILLFSPALRLLSSLELAASADGNAGDFSSFDRLPDGRTPSHPSSSSRRLPTHASAAASSPLWRPYRDRLALCHGMCALCGIDISSRAGVRAYLRALMASDSDNSSETNNRGDRHKSGDKSGGESKTAGRRRAVTVGASGCDPEELRGVNEAWLAAALGPVWCLRLRDSGLVAHYAHHNCLAWAGVLADFVAEAEHPAVLARLAGVKRWWQRRRLRQCRLQERQRRRWRRLAQRYCQQEEELEGGMVNSDIAAPSRVGAAAAASARYEGSGEGNDTLVSDGGAAADSHYHHHRFHSAAGPDRRRPRLEANLPETSAGVTSNNNSINNNNIKNSNSHRSNDGRNSGHAGPAEDDPEDAEDEDDDEEEEEEEMRRLQADAEGFMCRLPIPFYPARRVSSAPTAVSEKDTANDNNNNDDDNNTLPSANRKQATAKSNSKAKSRGGNKKDKKNVSRGKQTNKASAGGGGGSRSDTSSENDTDDEGSGRYHRHRKNKSRDFNDASNSEDTDNDSGVDAEDLFMDVCGVCGRVCQLPINGTVFSGTSKGNCGETNRRYNTHCLVHPSSSSPAHSPSHARAPRSSLAVRTSPLAPPPMREAAKTNSASTAASGNRKGRGGRGGGVNACKNEKSSTTTTATTTREAASAASRPSAGDGPVTPIADETRVGSGGMRGCVMCGRPFHLPCALLAGPAACVVYGTDDPAAEEVELWCGACIASR